MEVYRRLLGDRNAQTSVAALKLFMLLTRGGEGEAAASVFAPRLSWLLTTDTEALPDDQREVRAALENLLAQLRSNQDAPADDADRKA